RPSASYITQVSGGGFWIRGEIYAGARHLATYENDLATPTTFFEHTDWLGTERVETAVNGTACEMIQSVAFGDGLNTSGSCDPSAKYFTGKERDWESNLDNFGARYNSSQLGRFISPDPINLTAKRLIDPANTLNKYVYGGNNPLLYVDRTGRDITVFYRAPSGAQADAGHILLAVTNQATGAVRFADYYPKGTNKGLLPVQGELNSQMTSERLKQMAALT